MVNTEVNGHNAGESCSLVAGRNVHGSDHRPFICFVVACKKLKKSLFSDDILLLPFDGFFGYMGPQTLG
jgi:hypothetical protein